MSNFTKEHLNIDVVHDLGMVYTQELGNYNGSIRETGVRLSANRTLLLTLGIGTTFPVLGEYIEELSPPTDYLSLDAYAIPDSMRTLLDVYTNGYDIEALGYNSDNWQSATHEDRSAAVVRFLVMKRMKERQALTLDVVSYNSHGMVQFGRAKEAQAPVLFNLETNSVGSIDRQLSTYNLMKISREVTAVMFNSNNILCLAVNRDELNVDFRGMIEYEILDTATSSEIVIERKRLLMTNASGEIDYIPVTEGLFIDTVYDGDAIMAVVEVVQSESTSPINIDGTIVSNGEWFVINKTDRSMRISFANGDTMALDPFGIMKTSSSQPVSATTFKATYTRPSTVSGNISDGLLYKDRSRFNKSLISKFFVEDVKMAIYAITPVSAKVIGGSGQDFVFGPYKINADFSNVTINQFGDNENVFYAVRINEVDMYFDGDDVYAKSMSDLNFTQVIMPTERVSGEYRRTIGNITFSTTYDILAGSIHRDKEFIYESNFMISTDAVTAEIVGNAYPTSYFRVERVNKNICGNKGNFPLPDGHVNSKNSYAAGEVSVVHSRTDGTISVNNNKNTANNTIVYSYKAVAGKISDTPMIIESFGYVSKNTLASAPTEHFLSAKIRDSFNARTRKRYAGLIEKMTAPYIVMWIKLRNVITKETTFLFEHEYTDEHACHLGHSSFLSQKSGCGTFANAGASKLSWVTNMMKYTQFWSKTDNSIVPGNIEVSELKLNKGVKAIALGSAGSLLTRSIDEIGGIGVTALSAQVGTVVKDTSLLTEPTILRADDNLFIRMSVMIVPEVGFTYYTERELVFNDILDYTVHEIIEPYKRGIRYEWAEYTLEATLEYVPDETIVYAKYVLTDLNEENYSTIIEQRFPDGAISTSTMYEVDKLYRRFRDLNDHNDYGEVQKCIPMYLANTLFSKFGHIQNITGVWDEGSGVIIDDASFSFLNTTRSVGYKVIPICSGAEPIDIIDHYVMLSVYKMGKPYDVSAEMRVCMKKTGLIDGFEEGATAEADILFEDGEEMLASKRILDGITKNIHASFFLQVSPVLFGTQGPWKNPVDYVTEDEKILLSSELSYKIKPKSRVIMQFNVGADNILHFNMPGRKFDEMYNLIDGFVEEEVVSNNKQTPIQRGSTTYSLKYINHAGGGILLDRSVIIDLQAYPARLSYPLNNITRELISPVREDGHSKKMDARAVYVRFDTRYVSESIHSYYDKFAEAPTALTCDSLPEEAVLNRTHGNDHSLYDNLLTEVLGNNLLATGGKILLSFDNDTEEEQTLTPVYANTRRSYIAGRSVGVSSFKLDDAYRLMKKSLLFRGSNEENPDGRQKQGSKFVGTEILGE